MAQPLNTSDPAIMMGKPMSLLAGEWIAVVDNDRMTRESIRFLLEAHRLPVRTYESAAAFLSTPDYRSTACLILDFRMDGMTGLQLQERLAALGEELSIILVTGHADVRLAVQAMKLGAIDVLEKPFEDHALLANILQGVNQHRRRQSLQAEVRRCQEALQSLTPREREVLDAIVAGATGKVMARQLGLSEKTIDYHRAKLKDRFGARNSSDLVRKAMLAGTGPTP